MLRNNDTAIAGYTPKASPNSDEYKARVSEPSIAAIDNMPSAWRALVREHGYVPVYLLWRKGVDSASVPDRLRMQG